METKSIEENINEYLSFRFIPYTLGGLDVQRLCVNIATEQDRIARKEERERCIRIVQEWYCEELCVGFDPKSKSCLECKKTIDLRKAIEGGEE